VLEWCGITSLASDAGGAAKSRQRNRVTPTHFYNGRQDNVAMDRLLHAATRTYV